MDLRPECTRRSPSRNRKRAVLLAVLFCLPCLAQDAASDLLSAAKKGQTQRVRTLLDHGAAIESTDKEGNTPLILAADHGHEETVSLLLSKGAKPDARDKVGLDAYALTFLAQNKNSRQLLALLPAPPHVNLSINAAWIPENVYSSCFQNPQQLQQKIREISPDAFVLASFREAAAAGDAPFLELSAAGGDLVLVIRVRPGVMCVQQQSTDNLKMEVDVSLKRSGSQSAMWEKTFGGGLKGLRANSVTSPVQYQGVFEERAKAFGSPIYWAVVTELLRSR